jgi:hypothetical protein
MFIGWHRVGQRGSMLAMRIKKRFLFSFIAALFSVVMTTFCALAQSNVVTLSLEQSTDGLSNWQNAEISTEVLQGGKVVLPMLSDKTFYRLKIEPPPTNTMAPAISVSPNTYSNTWTIFSFNPNNNYDFFSVTISNSGGSPLEVSGLNKISGASLFNYYLNSQPFVIAAGQSTNALVLINMVAGSNSSIDDQIAITSNAESGNSNIVVRGSYWIDGAGGGP